MKRVVWRKLSGISLLYDLEGSISYAITFLQTLEKKYKDKELKLETDYDYESTSLILKFKDLETDEELSTRLAREEQVKKSAEANERCTLKLLKNKYEKK